MPRIGRELILMGEDAGAIKNKWKYGDSTTDCYYENGVKERRKVQVLGLYKMVE